MPQIQFDPGVQGSFANAAVITEMALRSAEQLCSMNMSATSVLLQTQASAASIFGLPDWSPLIAASTEQTRKLLSSGTDQVLQAAQHAREVVSELQRSTTELVESQTAKASEALQAGVEQLSTQARDTFSKAQDATAQFAEDSASAALSAMERMPKPDLPRDPVAEAVQNVLPPEGESQS